MKQLEKSLTTAWCVTRAVTLLVVAVAISVRVLRESPPGWNIHDDPVELWVALGMALLLLERIEDLGAAFRKQVGPQ